MPVDALFLKKPRGERIVQRAALMGSGVASVGYREILGVKIGDTKRFAKIARKAVACLEAGFVDAMAVVVLPDKYRQRLTTNLQE